MKKLPFFEKMGTCFRNVNQCLTRTPKPLGNNQKCLGDEGGRGRWGHSQPKHGRYRGWSPFSNIVIYVLLYTNIYSKF